MVGNWYAAFSNNFGVNWTHASPFTTFPSADGGFCCDQQALYEPSRDMMVWLLQYIKDNNTSTGQGRVRIALYDNLGRDIAATGWRYYDFLPSMFNATGAKGEWFDYPRLALSNKFLYLAINVFTTTSNSWTRTIIMRLPLDQLAAGGGVSIDYLSWTANFNFTPIEGAKDVMYWASQQTNGLLRVFRWPDNTSQISFFDIGVAAWNTGAHSCPTADGRNWCSFSDNRVLAAARSWSELTRQSELWFFWNVAQGGTFPVPYIEGVRIRESDLLNVGRPALWSGSTVWHYVGSAPNGRGDIGLSLFFGPSPNFFPSHAACLADDINGYPAASWECYTTAFGTNGPAGNRWGDFVTVRAAWPSDLAWQAVGWTLQGGQGANFVQPTNIVFGRGRDYNQYVRYYNR
jgi:hypothetical protein